MIEGDEYVWVVSTGSGYYAESVWTTEEAAWEEAERIGEVGEGFGRAVKRWRLNAPDQIWANMNEVDDPPVGE